MKSVFRRQAMLRSSAAILAVVVLAPDVALAQVEDIIVTARKRDESLIDSPVTISAFSAKSLERFGLKDLTQVADQTPALVINKGFGGTGGSIALRGISTGGIVGVDQDQAVSMNIDGIVISRATTLPQGFFDVGQIEILKGPQALFFGKNSPGGIISFRTADPGNDFEAILRGSYEFEARGKIAEAIISGPLSDSWGARLAFQFKSQDGAYRNTYPNASHSRLPNGDDYFGRLTLKGDINDRFDVRAKLALGHSENSGTFSAIQSFFCPNPTVAYEDCRVNDTVVDPDAPASVTAFDPKYHRNGRPWWRLKTALGSVEMNYDLGLFKLTNVFGISYHQRRYTNVNPSINPAAPNVFAGSGDSYRSTTNETRLASQLEGPLQFMVGGFYQDAHAHVVSSVVIFALNTFMQTNMYIDTQTYSFFGQASYELFPGFNVSGGVRYTNEEKTGDVFRRVFFAPALAPYALNSKLKVEDTSPELTLSYKPTQDINIYGSYKEGFKSGGFNHSTTAQRLTFGPESISGYEVGVKTRLLDDQVGFNVAAFKYKYKDLQVSVFNTDTASIELLNATSAKSKGIEAEVTVNPRAVPGLTLNGSITYMHARFADYLANCYVGQSIAAGCNLTLVGGVYRQQNANGRQLLNAPDLSYSLRSNYETDISSTVGLGIAGAVNYKGKYNNSDTFNPYALQRRSWKFDASVRLFTTDDRWELALIGRNLTNVRRATFVYEVGNTGGGTGTASAVLPNLQGDFGDSRAITLQATMRY